jgi:outer membrane protein OmpA-like peptidoglycan-associated protein
MRSRWLTSLWLKRIFFNSLILICVHATIFAQKTERAQPTWWFGGAGAANLNFYGGTTQLLNSALTVPTAFNEGFGAGLYLAPLVEYRPNPVWGGILQVGYDVRGGSFDEVLVPSGEKATLEASICYISIEPSLRFAPFSNGFYIFGGPRIGFNWALPTEDEKAFVYKQTGKSDLKAEFSDMRGTVFSGQIGIGYDIALASPNDEIQANLSPFVSFQPDFGQKPRSVESWSVSTLRLGVAIKFGSGAVIPGVEPTATPAVIGRDVQFSVRAPKAVVKHRVRETFPLRNYVFFEEGSTEIPNRYEALTKDQAASFKEDQLQEVQPKSMTGRSIRQMTVYYNILNIVGDRMKRSPGAAISLIGASEKGPEHGKARAETIKRYLVDVFGIEGSRITTEGRDKPRIPSEVPGGTKELALLGAEDRRVDIESNSPEMMIQVGGGPHYILKPVQIVAVVEDPLDSHVLFNVVGAKEVLASWSLEITDEQGKVQRFGPFTRERETVPGNTILGGRSQGDYQVVMVGQTKGGKVVRKESSVRLVRRDQPIKEAARFSILFDYDKSKTVASYEKFLTEIVTPLILDNGTVVIHGHTDIIGEEEYNYNLSYGRAHDAQSIIERAVSNSGKRGVTLETLWFGEDLQYAPFENYFPEGRFYNRTVIIDIVPD